MAPYEVLETFDALASFAVLLPLAGVAIGMLGVVSVAVFTLKVAFAKWL
jgi:hypothetical protein